MDISIISVGKEGNSTPVDHIENQDLVLDISSIDTSLNALLPVHPNCCIYRIPCNIHRLNEEDYTPRVVSIGPFHHGKKELQAMEEQKLICLQSFLDYTKLSLEDCMELVTGWEERARSCYSEKVNLTSDEFRKMILLDSCFLLETICRGKTNEHMLDARRDMVLLENQLPFFVLDGLFKQGYTSFYKETFLQLCIVYFAKIMLQNKVGNMINEVLGSEVRHFVDLLRFCHLPSAPRSFPKNPVVGMKIKCAAELQESGMSFLNGSRDHVLDIRYSTTGMLEIPKISVGKTSECLLRNLIALERCHYPLETPITDYVFFLDKLINTTKDVDILVQNDIIQNWMGESSDVAALFSSLGAQISTWWPAYYYAKISEDLNLYCSLHRSWLSIGLIRNNFSTPLRTTATVMATILLVVTYTKSMYSIIYYGF